MRAQAFVFVFQKGRMEKGGGGGGMGRWGKGGGGMGGYGLRSQVP